MSLRLAHGGSAGLRLWLRTRRMASGSGPVPFARCYAYDGRGTASRPSLAHPGRCSSGSWLCRSSPASSRGAAHTDRDDGGRGGRRQSWGDVAAGTHHAAAGPFHDLRARDRDGAPAGRSPARPGLSPGAMSVRVLSGLRVRLFESFTSAAWLVKSTERDGALQNLMMQRPPARR